MALPSVPQILSKIAAIASDATLGDFYSRASFLDSPPCQRLRAAVKPGSVVAAAVANRWIRRLYHEMKTPSGKLSVAVSSARSEDS